MVGCVHSAPWGGLAITANASFAGVAQATRRDLPAFSVVLRVPPMKLSAAAQRRLGQAANASSAGSGIGTGGEMLPNRSLAQDPQIAFAHGHLATVCVRYRPSGSVG